MHITEAETELLGQRTADLVGRSVSLTGYVIIDVH